MSLLQEDLARARLSERLAEAEASRHSRAARARRRERALVEASRRPVARVTRVTYRARLLIGLGRPASTR